MNPSCIIVVPLYQTKLSEDELISLHQLERICPQQPKCIVAPEGLMLPEQVQDWPEQRFDPAYFQGIQGYNRLMLSAEFYQRFDSYEYILIHQTDAFLFRNEIEQWCQAAYPYVGAPWLIKRKYQGAGRVLLWMRAIPHRLQHRPFLPLDFGGKVGNGGLSLRKTSECLQVCHRQSAEIHRWLALSQTIREYNEDCFWATRPDWCYPTGEQALTFSMDLDPEDAMRQNQNHLPMGCHGWIKPAYRSFWWPYIQQSML